MLKTITIISRCTRLLKQTSMDNGFNCKKNNQILHFLLFDLNHDSMSSLVKRDLNFTKIESTSFSKTSQIGCIHAHVCEWIKLLTILNYVSFQYSFTVSISKKQCLSHTISNELLDFLFWVNYSWNMQCKGKVQNV